jgi:hypothetical protein
MNDSDTFRKRTSVPLHQAVALFMTQADQSVNRFNARQACLYTGLQLEELGEKIEVIIGGCVTDAQRQHLAPLHSMLRHFAKEFRNGLHEGDMLRCNHAELIDADFDTAWVSLGALMSTSTNALGAIAHGSFTNLDKFRNGCVKDANGKVQKPADWQAPDFEPFTDKSVKD